MELHTKIQLRILKYQNSKQNQLIPTYTYIPSPECKIAPNAAPDLTPAQAALQKADAMEQKVAETLSMRL